ncbi:MAG: sigma 54-interacting transcriptional regulator [Vicinamibacterales bacterium]
MYRDVASLPLPASIEDHFLAALRALTATLDVQGVCDAVLRGVETAFGASSSWAMLHDPTTNLLRTALFMGRGADVYRAVEIPASCGVTGLAFTRAEIQFVADAAKENRWFDPGRVRTSGLRSVLIVPLVAAETCIGVLGLDAPQFGPGRPPTALDIKRLEVFAAQAAVGLVNARLFESSQQDRARMRALLQERRTLRREVIELRDEVRHAYSFGPIVGESAGLQTVLKELEQVATSNVTVLLLGETGTGKELLARALHERSSRAQSPFVPVNCAALPENLVESELFGHERGAFTGAHSRKAGRFELAHRGTLFLDEIGDLPLNAQAKLLRILQDRELHRVGSTQAVKLDIRLVAATNRDLAACVTDGTFREDLFYRLSVFPLRIPPLRERPGDIPLLARHLTVQCAKRLNRRVTGLTEGATAALNSYDWPGNVRELQNVIERAVILAVDGVVSIDTIRLDHVPRRSTTVSEAPVASSGPQRSERRPGGTLADAERTAIMYAIRRCEGRVSGSEGAAALLGLKPTTLHAKMKKLGVTRGEALRI